MSVFAFLILFFHKIYRYSYISERLKRNSLLAGKERGRKGRSKEETERKGRRKEKEWKQQSIKPTKNLKQ